MQVDSYCYASGNYCYASGNYCCSISFITPAGDKTKKNKQSHQEASDLDGNCFKKAECKQKR